VSEAEYSAGQTLEWLQKAGYRTTAARRAVIEAILAKDRHFTGGDIVDELAGADGAVGRATVFRTLDLLVELEVIGRVHRADGASGYVLCPRGHHHHAICSRCGLVLDLPGCPLGQAAEEEAQIAGFRLQGHRLEYFGLCSDCQKGGNS
jgi:Fur family transcriptional regulator, ferric uptake regulator